LLFRHRDGWRVHGLRLGPKLTRGIMSPRPNRMQDINGPKRIGPKLIYNNRLRRKTIPVFRGRDRSAVTAYEIGPQPLYGNNDQTRGFGLVESSHLLQPTNRIRNTDVQFLQKALLFGFFTVFIFIIFAIIIAFVL
jgi:hypothetical protein